MDAVDRDRGIACDSANDVATGCEPGILARSGATRGHHDVGRRVDRRGVVVVPAQVARIAIVGEPESVAAAGKSGEVVTAVLAGDIDSDDLLPALSVIAISSQLDGAAEQDSIGAGDGAGDAPTGGEPGVHAASGQARRHLDVGRSSQGLDVVVILAKVFRAAEVVAVGVGEPKPVGASGDPAGDIGAVRLGEHGVVRLPAAAVRAVHHDQDAGQGGAAAAGDLAGDVTVVCCPGGAADGDQADERQRQAQQPDGRSDGGALPQHYRSPRCSEGVVRSVPGARQASGEETGTWASCEGVTHQPRRLVVPT